MKRKKNPKTLAELTTTMLASRMPLSDDTESAMAELGIKPTCAAYVVFGLIQKACKGDSPAAKFLNELSTVPDDTADTNVSFEALSDAMLMKLAGVTLRDMKVSDEDA